ncbi:tRNA (5-methylaminomethyl-2-thiouridine)(34)-methyltransferase MnmD [Ensifer soli]|uniref:tRNA (5-methylaminomethyl-2-thiouridine)(34)-methyltransferase MnmD n=1 Tax=Ciceribacter sp. sgz301302 TaxID=3342379 RepID=UPI0035B9CD51
MTGPSDTPPADTNGAPLAWHDGDMPYSTVFGDHFYCRHDGRLECGHVFLDGNGLPARWIGAAGFTIAELGFGTGLNFCETLRQWRRTAPRGQTLTYVSFERYPMDGGSIDRALARWPELAAERESLVTRWPQAPSATVALDFEPDVRLLVVCGDAFTALSDRDLAADAWFLDGFAPSRNPDMWSPELMALVHAHTRPGGGFATYAAAGFVRRNLQAAGFSVERRPGFADKREMLCGKKSA